jgi:hypothetical protein
MSYRVCDLKTTERWKVLFRDKNVWLAGLYVPEFTHRDEISLLEKHDAPELFYLIDGNVTLVLGSEDGTVDVPLDKNQAIFVGTWHNAYRPMGGFGLVLVVERDGVKTEFKNVKEFSKGR